MEVDSNQDNNTIDAFFNHFEQWKLECQQKYLSHIKLILNNQEAKKILFDLKSYLFSYRAAKIGNILFEKIEVNKPINEIDESDVPNGSNGSLYLTKTNGKRLLDEPWKNMEKILYDEATLKDASSEYKSNLINFCGKLAIKTICKQRNINYDIVRMMGIKLTDLKADIKDGSFQVSFDNIDTDEMLQQEGEIKALFRHGGIRKYVDLEKNYHVFKDLLCCSDFISIVNNFNDVADNNIYQWLNRRIFECDYKNYKLTKIQMKLLDVFAEFSCMGYKGIKESIKESNLSKRNIKKLYQMMSCRHCFYDIFFDTKSIINTCLDGVFSFSEILEIIKITSINVCTNVGYDGGSLEKIRLLAIAYKRYLHHDYDAYLENSQSEYNTYKSLYELVLDLINSIASENKIPTEQINGFKETIKDACSVNIFGVIIQFIKNLFLREENRAVMWNYENIKLDRLASNIMKVLPKILTDIYRNDNTVIGDKNGEKEIKDKGIQIENVVIIEENNIIPNQGSGINEDNIDKFEEDMK